MSRGLMIAAAAVVVLAAPSYGYLDPVAGSVILQVILGGVAGLLVLFKLYWRKLRDLFRPGRQADPKLGEHR